MQAICCDDRYEVVERYKQKLINATNIEDSPEEMKVLDDILFRFWQMGWIGDGLISKKDLLEKVEIMIRKGKGAIDIYDLIKIMEVE